MSEYGFLCYRVTEFLHQLDFEYADITELIEDSKKEKIKDSISVFKKKYSIEGNREVFYKLCMDRELYKLFNDEILNKYDYNEKKWLQHYLYSQMDSYYKMHIRDKNNDTTIRFVEISDKDLFTIDTITNVVNETINENNK